MEVKEYRCMRCGLVIRSAVSLPVTYHNCFMGRNHLWKETSHPHNAKDSVADEEEEEAVAVAVMMTAVVEEKKIENLEEEVKLVEEEVALVAAETNTEEEDSLPQINEKKRVIVKPSKEIRVSPYPPEFNTRLRHKIRERDDFRCRHCGRGPDDRAHDIHHIDGNKMNSDEDNLVTLCSPCHGGVHFAEQLGFGRPDFGMPREWYDEGN